MSKMSKEKGKVCQGMTLLELAKYMHPADTRIGQIIRIMEAMRK